VGEVVGTIDDEVDGAFVGRKEGLMDGMVLGEMDGISDDFTVGLDEGKFVGKDDGEDGFIVGTAVGLFVHK